MKAVIYTRYGGPEVLHLADVETPTPRADEVLVKVHATTVTSADVRLRSLRVPAGFGLMVRLFFGIRKPRKPILGGEFAGVVEAVGPDVTGFEVGDAVFGASNSRGCYAEYVAVPEDGPIAHKPEALSFEEAAAVAFGGLSSLTYVRDFGEVVPGQHVLIYGASGALGTYAVQLAKHFGARVTGVCSTANLDLVRSLGADAVIDYTQRDFAADGPAYDVIFETVGKVPYAHGRRALKPGGRYLLAVAGMGEFMQVLWSSLSGRKDLKAGDAVFTQPNLLVLKGLLEEGVIRPVIDRYYTLAQVPEAHRYVDTGRKRGNVVIRVAAPASASDEG